MSELADIAPPAALESPLARLLSEAAEPKRAGELLDMLEIDPALLAEAGPEVSRAAVSMALGALLFDDLLARVPTGRAYVEDVRAAGGTVMLDHGALRTIRFPSGPTGDQPGGREAFARILGPLGYYEAAVYPLERLKMTGYAFRHRDLPQTLPQYFVSELHVDRFSEAFQPVATRVFGSTHESMTHEARALLDALAASNSCSAEIAAGGLSDLAAAFRRWHEMPCEADYEALLAESAEAAWISTEGATFNHATDRVDDVEALAAGQRAMGRPIKDAVEVSGTGRVRQTAFKADPVTREFPGAGGAAVSREVPGSFYEFITRDPLPADEGDGLDLSFDSANATGIFKMTEGKRG